MRAVRVFVAVAHVAALGGCALDTQRCPDMTLLFPSAQGGYAGGCRPVCDGGPCAEAGVSAPRPCDPPCSGDAPRCADGTCVQCTSGAGDCPRDLPFCLDGTCVQCVNDQGCGSPSAPICQNQACVACARDRDCENVDGLQVCDVPTATCVECNRRSFLACAEGVCDTSSRTCAQDRPPGGRGLCEPCVGDRECMLDQLCVLMTVEAEPGVALTVGRFCQWRKDSRPPIGPFGSCPSVAPFSRDEAAVSVDGVAVTICTLRQPSTCPAYGDAVARTPCDRDEDCGVPDVPDGVCVDGRCSLRCDIDVDCPGDPPMCVEASSGARECRPPPP
ncbi:MAG: hypothetical protein ACFCGT_23965 [Sandaracinaceae bacterium]